MAVNLGNIVGVIKSVSPPLEADGVTEKRYVLWARIIGTSPERYDLNYFDVDKNDWVSFRLNQNENIQAINTRFNELIGAEGDEDSIINTITDIVKAFQGLNEGERTLLNLIETKTDKNTKKYTGDLDDLQIDGIYYWDGYLESVSYKTFLIEVRTANPFPLILHQKATPIGGGLPFIRAYDGNLNPSWTTWEKFEPAFEKNTAFNKNKSDSYNNNNTNTLATSKAVRDFYTNEWLDATRFRNRIKAVDGPNSGIDADSVDGWHQSDLRDWDNILNRPHVCKIYGIDEGYNGYSGTSAPPYSLGDIGDMVHVQNSLAVWVKTFFGYKKINLIS